MTTVWVTRTEPGASELAEALYHHGFGVVKAPVLAVAPTGEAAPAGSFDVAIYLSQHAVRYGDPSNLTAAALVAVGRKTAGALPRAQAQVMTPREATSEGIRALVAESFAAARRILIVSGVNGRRDLRDWLVEDGHRVDVWAVYSRMPAEVDHDVVAPGRDLFTSIDVVEATSIESLRRIESLWHAHGNMLGFKLPVLVPSERVGERARNIGFDKVVNCGGATADDVVRMLGSEEWR